MIRQRAGWFVSWTFLRPDLPIEHGAARNILAAIRRPRRLQSAGVNRERPVCQVVRNQLFLDLRINGAATEQVKEARDLALRSMYTDRRPCLEGADDPAINYDDDERHCPSPKLGGMWSCRGLQLLEQSSRCGP